MKKRDFFAAFSVMLVISATFVPTYWRKPSSGVVFTEYQFIFEKERYQIIDSGLLAIQVAVVIILGATFFYLFVDKEK